MHNGTHVQFSSSASGVETPDIATYPGDNDVYFNQKEEQKHEEGADAKVSRSRGKMYNGQVFEKIKPEETGDTRL